MSRPPGQSVTSLYSRLFRYARPYWFRLTVGIVAGILVAGSLYALLRISPKIFSPFEQGATEQVSEEPGDALPEGSAELGFIRDFAAKHSIPLEKPDGSMTWQLFALSLIAAPILFGARAISIYLHRYYMRWIGARVVRDLRDALFRVLESQSLKFFGKCDIGSLIGRCTNDATVVEHVMATIISDVTRAPLEILASVGFVVAFSIEKDMVGLVAVMFFVFPLCIVPIIILGRFVRRYSKRSLERISDLVSRMHEVFTGIKVIKAFHTERAEEERFRKLGLSYFKAVVKALRAELLMAPLMEGVALTVICVFIVVCYAHEIAVSQIIPVALAAIMVYRPTKQLGRINANLQKGAAALERIYEILDTDTSLAEIANPTVIEGFTDAVVFEDVSFAYDAGAQPVLTNISLKMPRGTVMAFVGESGSGKTTVANLLARFYDPTGGRVLLDGVDLREAQIASLRKLIGVVTQETILFNDTVANNIAYGLPGATRDQVIDAAKKANAHDFIMAEPDGYDRVVGEKGFVLSGGEKQRIAIARAILRDPPILILDEATSALDTVTEQLVQEAIARVMTDRTVFAIAHRLSTIKHADQIMLVDEGRIAEEGTHEELLQAGGRYRALCEMQVLDG